MIVNQYHYPHFTRCMKGGKRHYSSGTGEDVFIPSVTTILDATKEEESKKALENWRKRIGSDRAQQITTEAASRGTRMHAYLEKYVLTEEMPKLPDNPFAQPSWFMAASIVANTFSNINEVWGVEKSLAFKNLWAGTTDCVGLWKGKPAIIDFKQTNRKKKEEWITDYKLQLAAYAMAHDSMFGTEINQGIILMAVAPQNIEDTSVPEVQVFEVIDDFDDWKEKWLERVSEYYLKN